MERPVPLLNPEYFSPSVQTIFYKDEKRRVNDAIVAPLTRGTALLHRYATLVCLNIKLT